MSEMIDEYTVNLRYSALYIVATRTNTSKLFSKLVKRRSSEVVAP